MRTKQNKTKKHLVGALHDNQGILPLHSFGDPKEEVVKWTSPCQILGQRNSYPRDLRKDSEPGPTTTEVSMATG